MPHLIFRLEQPKADENVQKEVLLCYDILHFGNIRHIFRDLLKTKPIELLGDRERNFLLHFATSNILLNGSKFISLCREITQVLENDIAFLENSNRSLVSLV